MDTPCMESKDDIIVELRAIVEKQAQQITDLAEEVGFPQHSRFRNQRTVINDHIVINRRQQREQSPGRTKLGSSQSPLPLFSHVQFSVYQLCRIKTTSDLKPVNDYVVSTHD